MRWAWHCFVVSVIAFTTIGRCFAEEAKQLWVTNSCVLGPTVFLPLTRWQWRVAVESRYGSQSKSVDNTTGWHFRTLFFEKSDRRVRGISHAYPNAKWWIPLYRRSFGLCRGSPRVFVASSSQRMPLLGWCVSSQRSIKVIVTTRSWVYVFI